MSRTDDPREVHAMTPDERAEERRRFVADMMVTAGIDPTREAIDAVIAAADERLGNLDHWRPTGLLNRPGITVVDPDEPPADVAADIRTAAAAIERNPRSPYVDRDVATIRTALERLPAACHYHGTRLDRPGPFGPACCGTGTTALARREALAALDRVFAP